MGSGVRGRRPPPTWFSALDQLDLLPLSFSLLFRYAMERADCGSYLRNGLSGVKLQAMNTISERSMSRAGIWQGRPLAARNVLTRPAHPLNRALSAQIFQQAIFEMQPGYPPGDRTHHQSYRVRERVYVSAYVNDDLRARDYHRGPRPRCEHPLPLQVLRRSQTQKSAR